MCVGGGLIYIYRERVRLILLIGGVVVVGISAMTCLVVRLLFWGFGGDSSCCLARSAIGIVCSGCCRC